MTEPVKRVPRLGRVLDVVGIMVFVAGASLYVHSWLGLRAMDEFVSTPDAPGSAIEHADGLSGLGRIGFALMALGVLVGVAAAIVARRLSRGT